MAPKDGALALGAGATIGTSADDGFTVSAAITLVLMLPGPVIALIGKANILSKRIGGANQDANFDAMAVYDGNSETFDLNDRRPLRDSRGARDRRHGGVARRAESRLRPRAGSSRSAYRRMTSGSKRGSSICSRPTPISSSATWGSVTGTWTGYPSSWSFGPLSVSLDAYLATLAAIQWSPLQIAGGIELHGDVHLEAFGIGLGITADALLEGCAPNPFWVHGEIQRRTRLALAAARRRRHHLARPGAATMATFRRRR